MNKPTIQLIYEKSKSFFILNSEMKNDLLNKKRKKKLKEMFDDLYFCLGSLKLSDLGIEDVEPFTEHHLFMPIFESDLFVISLFVLPTAELIKPTFGTIGSENYFCSIF
jgi:hypothetical protein